MISEIIYQNGNLIGHLLVDFISHQFGFLLADSPSELLIRHSGNCQRPWESIETVRSDGLTISESVRGMTSPRLSLT